MQSQKPSKPASSKNGHRGHHRQGAIVQVKKVASPGMFLLQKKSGAENHTPEWERRLEHTCCSLYGDLGKSVKLGAYFDIPDPVRPDITIPGSAENLAAIASTDTF